MYKKSEWKLERIKDTKSFIDRAIWVWLGEKYDYSKVDFKKSSEKVEIICRIHGSFYMTPNNHITGYGCPSCGVEYVSMKKRSNTEEFKIKAKTLLGDFYDYSNVVYTGSREKVEIICPYHGPFLSTPNNHLRGKRCPDCSSEKRERGEFVNSNSLYGLRGYYGTEQPANIYIFLIGDSHIKVGVSKDIENRANTIEKSSGLPVEILYRVHGVAKKLWDIEQEIHSDPGLIKDAPENKFTGKSECYKREMFDKIKNIISRKCKNEGFL